MITCIVPDLDISTWTVCLTFVDITGDKLVRATELVKLLSLEKSMKGAIKLVTALKLPHLAERFSSILEVCLFSILTGHGAEK